MPSETTKRTLLERIRDLNDQASWREFDEQYRELILRFGLRRGLQPADAEDVRQIVMVALARRLPEFTYRPEAGRFRDYLGIIVRNAVSKRWTRQDRDHELLRLTDTASLSTEDEEAWNYEWMLHHYRRALASIRETFQPKSLEIFEGLMEGSSGEELAARYDTTPDAVYKIKQRIRDRLEEHITRQLHEEDFAERGA